jgi:hypothetical protein
MFKNSASAPKHGNTPDNTMSSDSDQAYQYLPAQPFFCIASKDVLTKKEEISFKYYSRMKENIVKLMEYKGDYVEIAENFLVELADVDMCFEEVMTLADCLKKEANSGKRKQIIILISIKR